MFVSTETIFVGLEAKIALKNPKSKRLLVPYSDTKMLTSVYTKSLYQTEWDIYPDKLHRN